MNIACFPHDGIMEHTSTLDRDVRTQASLRQWNLIKRYPNHLLECKVLGITTPNFFAGFADAKPRVAEGSAGREAMQLISSMRPVGPEHSAEYQAFEQISGYALRNIINFSVSAVAVFFDELQKAFNGYRRSFCLAQCQSVSRRLNRIILSSWNFQKHPRHSQSSQHNRSKTNQIVPVDAIVCSKIVEAVA